MTPAMRLQAACTREPVSSGGLSLATTRTSPQRLSDTPASSCPVQHELERVQCRTTVGCTTGGETRLPSRPPEPRPAMSGRVSVPGWRVPRGSGNPADRRTGGLPHHRRRPHRTRRHPLTQRTLTPTSVSLLRVGIVTAPRRGPPDPLEACLVAKRGDTFMTQELGFHQAIFRETTGRETYLVA